jgi:4-amino-4-deoxy-L-arabinose transferase-like glycosyltransferase
LLGFTGYPKPSDRPCPPDKRGKTIFPRWDKNVGAGRGSDLLGMAVILFCCFSYALLRLLVSPSLELDEAEQFLNGAFFHLGYNEQAPLYSWIFWSLSLLFGKNLSTLIAIKYCLIFIFYFAFYLTARCFWSVKESLLITGSLLLFPTYSYEVNRDLSHTILVSAIAVITCLLFIRTMLYRKTAQYFLLGVFMGLGILSKYNFLFFLAALLLASLTTAEGRRVIFNRRIFLSLLTCIGVLLPHFFWLMHEDFLSLRYAVNISHIGELNRPSSPTLLSLLGAVYSEVVVFFAVTVVFLWRSISMRNAENNSALRVVRWLAVYSLTIPFIGIIFIGPSHFQSRWLAPVFFTLPLALFSLVHMKINETRFKLFGYLCMSIAIVVLVLRVFTGFFPDVTGKVERIHIPYRALVQQITEKLTKRGIDDLRAFAVISDVDDEHIAANILAEMPKAKFVSLKDVMVDTGVQRDILKRGGLLIYDISRRGLYIPTRFFEIFPTAVPETVTVPYLHSRKFPPYVLKVFIIPVKGTDR